MKKIRKPLWFRRKLSRERAAARRGGRVARAKAAGPPHVSSNAAIGRFAKVFAVSFMLVVFLVLLAVRLMRDPEFFGLPAPAQAADRPMSVEQLRNEQSARVADAKARMAAETAARKVPTPAPEPAPVLPRDPAATAISGDYQIGDWKVTVVTNGTSPNAAILARHRGRQMTPRTGDDLARCAPGCQVVCFIDGSERMDVYVGTPGDDVMMCNMNAHHCVIVGLGGDDIIYGSFGDDVLIGGPGRNRIFGNGGNDRIEDAAVETPTTASAAAMPQSEPKEAK